MRIKNLEIDVCRYYGKHIFGKDYYFYDYYDQKTNLCYPVELDTRQDREHYLQRINDDHSMYLVELLFYITTKRSPFRK